MRQLLAAVISREQAIEPAMWRTFWERLHANDLLRGEAAAVLASLSSRTPDPQSASALVSSLRERRKRTTVRFENAVNIVGTGGGLKTFNISTAAALVAAAQGVPVVKTGSRAYTSRVGSYDLLRKLGITLTTSYEQTAESLAYQGIAFAGAFVYPAELSMLAKTVAPLDFRVIGRAVNMLGPFLADVDASAQLTGVSRSEHLPVMQRLARDASPRRIWLATNELGADELLSLTVNEIHRNDASPPMQLEPHAIGLGAGAVGDLAPALPDNLTAAHFLALLGGDAPEAAIQTVCLNSAALTILAGHVGTWRDALQASAEVIAGGHAVRLLERLRARSEGTSHVLR